MRMSHISLRQEVQNGFRKLTGISGSFSSVSIGQNLQDRQPNCLYDMLSAPCRMELAAPVTPPTTIFTRALSDARGLGVDLVTASRRNGVHLLPRTQSAISVLPGSKN